MSITRDHDSPEPIAIVGMAMRFPGGSNSNEKFWDMLCMGRSAHRSIPKERYNANGYYHPDSARAGAINVKGGYFLDDDPLEFDAPFFSMTATEASGTDPQQRCLLEVTYEALENAGIPISNLPGSQTSVYVGCFTSDFESIGGRDPFGGPFYAATGNGASMLSNRISWFYDLRGPSMTIDTACSSSLYAVHLACQSLRLGESKMALVGGANLIYDPSYMRDMCNMKFLSPDGVCHSFDSRANGYARGDGIGGMVLKTLKQALADGDTIRAVIRNSGLGQDGKTPGITMPSPQAHAELIRSTYATAGLSLDDTLYFEAHGTGTSIGDPYELAALGATFGQTRNQDNPLYVGSVKANIGHLEGCAGLAGLMKTVLVLENGQIPPLAGFENPNARLKLDEWHIALPQSLVPWPTHGLRRASVNSFGYGGANAHLIVDDAYHYLQKQHLRGKHQTTVSISDWDSDSGLGSPISTPEIVSFESETKQKLFIFSSADQTGLSRISSNYSAFLEKLDVEKKFGSTAVLEFAADLAYTLSSRRTALDHRSFVVGKTGTDVQTALQKPIPRIRRTAKHSNVFFVFTGQGAQWPAMGRELICHSVFKFSLEQSQCELRELGATWLLEDEMFAYKETSHIDSPNFSQPLCTALQIALVDLLKSWGITPKSVVGHSSGEIAAAYAAGAITLQTAIKVAYFRGIYSADINRRQPETRGAMMAVGLSEEEVMPYLSSAPYNSVVVACINAPKNVTLSGDESYINEIEKALKEKGIFVRKLRVQTAYHSPHMEVIAQDYLNAMENLTPPNATPDVTIFSSVTAAPISGENLDSAYWIKNMVSTVRFSEAVHALVTQPAPGKSRRRLPVSYSAAIEIGPAEALKGPLVQILSATDERLVSSILYTSMLSRGVDAEISALTAAGKIWGQGININLNAVNFQESMEQRSSLACLPPYPWNHSNAYSHNSAWGKAYRFRENPRTDLLGMRFPNQNPSEPRWHNFVRLSEQPWMSDHRVQQMILFPGSSMVVMAIEAARELADPARILKAVETKDVSFKHSIVVPAGDDHVETALHLRPVLSGLSQQTSYEFNLFSQTSDEDWQEVCTGTVVVHYRDQRDSLHDHLAWGSEIEKYSKVRTRASKKLSPRMFYKIFDKKMNLQYGPMHKNITECVSGIGEGYGTVTIPNTKSVMPSEFEYPHLIHPATLDSVFHMQALGYLHSLSGEESLVPISISSVYISADISTSPGSQLKGYSNGTQSSKDSTGDIVLSDNDWSSPKVVVRGFLSRDISAANNNTAGNAARKCTRLTWVEMAPNDSKPEDAIIGDDGIPLLDDVPSLPTIDISEIILLTKAESSPGVVSMTEKLSLSFSELQYPIRKVSISDLGSDGFDLAGTAIISMIEAEEPLVASWTELEFFQFKSIISQATALLWITQGGSCHHENELQFGITTGLLRAVRVETPQLRLPHIDLDSGLTLDADLNVEAILTAFKTSILGNALVAELEFKVRNNMLLVPRLSNDDSFHDHLSGRTTQPKPEKLKLGDFPRQVEGSLDQENNQILWQQVDELDEIIPGDLEIETSVTNIDFINNTILGRDAVGTVKKVGAGVTGFAPGDVVVACASQTLKSRLRISQDLIRHVPAFTNSSMMVTLPSAICTAHAVILDIARLQTGESILICAQPGSTENALIHLATQTGANVFVLAQNTNHEQLLVSFMGINPDNVLVPTANISISSMIMSKTAGKGVDVVASTLVGQISQSALLCISDWGRFVGIGESSTLSAPTNFAQNITISNFNFEHMKATSPSRTAQLLTRAWERCRKDGFPQSSPIRTFPCTETLSAIKHLRSERCIGSTVMLFSQNHELSVLPPKPKKLSLNSESAYILAGGLGGIGRSIADLMYVAGARNIKFISRSGATTDEALHLLSSLRERGCNAEAFACDITDPKQVQGFVSECTQRGEIIKGVVQCAMVLRDSMFENMTFDQWTQATKPKVEGSWNLHQHMPNDMDFFIMLSSMAGVIGNPGQANYSAAGTYQDALSQFRRSKGLPSITVDLGIVSDVGYIAENPDQFERLDYLENLFISERELHSILSAGMLGCTSDGAPIPAQLITGVGKELLYEGDLGIAMSADLKYTNLQEWSDTGHNNNSEDVSIVQELKAAGTVREASSIVETVLSNELSKALNMETGDVDLEKPMHSFGVDSLVAVEVRNMIFRKMKAEISVFDILSPMPLAKLATKIVSKSKYPRDEIVALAIEELSD